MDRIDVYPGAIPLETDLLNTNRNVMIGLGKLIGDVLGTGTQVSGFAVTQNATPNLTVNVAPGQIYSLQNVDNTAYSSLPLNTTNQVMKQGIALNTTSLALTAPATAGQSVNYLIQVAFSEVDTNNATLLYYNAANPSVPFSGAGNNGVAQPTTRACQAVVSFVAGTAATTGTQTTPAPTAGAVGVAVVTVANGQTAITSANITPVSAAFPALAQQGNLRAGVVTLTATGSLTAAQTGSLVELNSATAATVTLPTPVGVAGQGFWLDVTGAGTWTVATAAGTFTGSGYSFVTGFSLLTTQSAYVVSDGTNWIVLFTIGSQGRYQNLGGFISSGTFTVPAGVTKIRVRLVGGGGGAGGSSATFIGGGGGAGGYAESQLTVTPGQTIAVTIGSGGTGGTTGVSGGVGGTTSFGTFASALGGNGGTSAASGSAAGGAPGGATGAGFALVSGGYGQDATNGNSSAMGGASAFGGGGRGAASTGTNAVAYGSGGGGCYTTTAASGGNGAPGYVLVEY